MRKQTRECTKEKPAWTTNDERNTENASGRRNWHARHAGKHLVTKRIIRHAYQGGLFGKTTGKPNQDALYKAHEYRKFGKSKGNTTLKHQLGKQIRKHM